MGLFGIKLQKELSAADYHAVLTLLKSVAGMDISVSDKADQMLKKVSSGKAISRSEVGMIVNYFDALVLTMMVQKEKGDYPGTESDITHAIEVANKISSKLKSL